MCPPHNYTYSWGPSPTYSAVYVSSQELYQYFKNFRAKHRLEKYIHLQHKVVGATWDGKAWKVQVEEVQTGRLVDAECDILINANGILNNWNWPDIPDLDKFQGKLLHSANWDTTVSLDNKSVGLSSTTHYTPSEKAVFSSSPSTLRALRKLNETSTNCLFGTFVKNSATQHDTRTDLTQQMQSRLNNPQLASAPIPSWSPGCRRLTPGVNYLESLTKPNVQICLGGVRSVTETGVVGPDGAHHDLDVLICAAGFNVSFRPRFPVINEAGTNLQDLWAKDPGCYFGTAVADMPNYILFLGPNCPVGDGPLLPVIETQADYMLKWIDRWQTENNMLFFHPKAAAVD
ncbi:hypothetical protein H2204_002893 [Knufia peltigerae]|uniref:FAD/NAD(P)-binding domain-containing protein n=1 Tax=Knufia peltigerae TaxID=1002370 RepID=A0AA38YA77_9EURO|nr:hypothetical protein H2204_002893 [Knufia peltigerae]